MLPRLENSKSINAFITSKNKIIEADYKFIGLDYASGCAMLINKKNLKVKIYLMKRYFYTKRKLTLLKDARLKT